MSASRKLVSELDDLEQQFATEIAKVASALQPLPQERDTLALEAAWRNATSIRRKISAFLKESLREINERTEIDGVTARNLRSVRKTLNLATTKIRFWGRFEIIVSAQIRSERQPLVEESSEEWREVDVFDHIIALFLDAMHKAANPTGYTQGDDANEYGCHRDIPLPMGRFSKMIAAAYRLCLAQQKDRPLRFLDVGSGGGTKVLAATTCFDLCDGIEYERSTVETGTSLLKLLSPNQCRLMHADALAFTEYEKYDVIYFYRPLVDFKKMVELEERIISQVRPGTVLLVAGGLLSSDLTSKNVHQLVDQIYVTGLPEAEAAELMVTAERMGSMVSGFGRLTYAHLGYWQPLYDVSRRNGYCI
jgi:16S rRNA G527 N7-methylase RsmG